VRTVVPFDTDHKECIAMATVADAAPVPNEAVRVASFPQLVAVRFTR
jgi:hypothetical protein